MPEQLAFAGFEPPPPPPPPGGPHGRPTDRLLFAIYLDAGAGADAVQLTQRLRGEHGLRGKSIGTNLLHITLLHLGDHDGLPPGLVTAACGAADTIRMHPFEVAFDRVMSFSRKQGNLPFVLRGNDGLAELRTFQRMVVAAMRVIGAPVASGFTPHVTLLYDNVRVAEQAVETIRWTVGEFVLVHSLLGQTRHIPLARWPLCG
jgi:2'-5' RNA ligase